MYGQLQEADTGEFGHREPRRSRSDMIRSARQRLAAFALAALATLMLSVLSPFAGVVVAVTVTWDGGGPTDNWSDQDNWDGDQVPAADNDIVLPASSGDVHLDASVTIASTFQIDAGTTLIVDAAGTLTLEGFLFGAGSLSNHGIIQAGSTVGFIGRQSLGGWHFTPELINHSDGAISGVEIWVNNSTSVVNNHGLIDGAVVLLRGSSAILNNDGAITGTQIAVASNSKPGEPGFNNLPGGTVTGGTLQVGGGFSPLGLVNNEGTIAGAVVDVHDTFNNAASGVVDNTGGTFTLKCNPNGPVVGKFNNAGTFVGPWLTVECKIWNGEGDGTSWSDPQNWAFGIPPVPEDVRIFIIGLPGEHTEVHLDTDFTFQPDFVQSVGNWWIRGESSLSTTFVIDPGVTLTIVDDRTQFFDANLWLWSATLINNGTLINQERIIAGLFGGAVPSTFINNGFFTNTGTYANNINSRIENHGTFQNPGIVDNPGELDNFGTFDNSGGEVLNYCTSVFANSGILIGDPVDFPCSTWDGGGGDGLWSNPLNWEPDGVPAESDQIILPASSGDVHLDASVTIANTFQIDAGTTLIVDAAGTLTLEGFLFGAGSLSNHGIIQAGSTVGFIGRQSLGGWHFTPELTNHSDGAIHGVEIWVNNSTSVMNNHGLIDGATVLLRGSSAILNNDGAITGTQIAVASNSKPGEPGFNNLPGGTVTGGTLQVGGGFSPLGFVNNEGTIAGAVVDVHDTFNNAASGVVDNTGGIFTLKCNPDGPTLGEFNNAGTFVGPGLTVECKIWNGGGDGTNWSDPQNWAFAIPPVSEDRNVFIIGLPGEHAEVHLDTDFTIQPPFGKIGNWWIRGDSSLSTTFVIDSGVTLTIVSGRASFFDANVRLWSATLINNGTLINEERIFAGIFSSVPGTFINNGIFTNTGTYANSINSRIENHGTIDNAGGFIDNQGVLDNSDCDAELIGSVDGNLPILASGCDTTPPVISTPANSTAEATSASGAVVEYLVTADDETDGALTPSCDPASGSTFPPGPTPTTVNCTATDAAGNSANASFTITVVDTIPPDLNAPLDITVEATDELTPVVLVEPAVSDLADPSPTVTNDAPAGFPIGPTTVTWTATDASSNTTTATQIVTVVDTTPPTLTAPADVTLEATGVSTPVVLVEPAISDLADPSPTVTNDAPAGFPVGPTTVTWVATDASNNTTTAMQVVTVQDTTPPVITAPPDIVSVVTGSVTPVNLGVASAVDLVDGAVPVAVDNAGPFGPGMTQVTWSATDKAGNTGSATQKVTLLYNFGGFLKPIANPPTVNTAKAGRTVPVKWQVSDGSGGYIRDTGIVSGLRFAQQSCADLSESYENPIEADTSGSSGLRYDTTSEQFKFNWKTSSTGGGQCYLFILRLNDGTSQLAKFKLK